MTRAQLTYELVSKWVRCDPERGLLYWNRLEVTPDMTPDERKSARIHNALCADKEALHGLSGYGYKRGTIKGYQVFAHRVIWLLVHGEWPVEIDHINGVKTDNRLLNLREVDRRQNMRNIGMNRRNTSGHTGVHKDRRTGKWIASIRENGDIMRHIGVFENLNDAVNARKAAESSLGYHANHGRKAHG